MFPYIRRRHTVRVRLRRFGEVHGLADNFQFF